MANAVVDGWGGGGGGAGEKRSAPPRRTVAVKIEQSNVIMSMKPTTLPIWGFRGSRIQHGLNDFCFATGLVELAIVKRRSGIPVFMRRSGPRFALTNGRAESCCMLLDSAPCG